MTFDPDVGDGAQFMDVAQLQAALAGYSLVDPSTDCEVTPAGAGGLAVDVSSGTARLGGPAESISAQSDVALPESDPDDPRKALVYLDDTGTVQTLGGDPAPAAPPNEERAKAAVPSVPIPASDYLPLASVWIPAGATTITSGDIRGRRVGDQRGLWVEHPDSPALLSGTDSFQLGDSFDEIQIRVKETTFAKGGFIVNGVLSGYTVLSIGNGRETGQSNIFLNSNFSDSAVIEMDGTWDDSSYPWGASFDTRGAGINAVLRAQNDTPTSPITQFSFDQSGDALVEVYVRNRGSV